MCRVAKRLKARKSVQPIRAETLHLTEREVKVSPCFACSSEGADVSICLSLICCDDGNWGATVPGGGLGVVDAKASSRRFRFSRGSSLSLFFERFQKAGVIQPINTLTIFSQVDLEGRTPHDSLSSL